VSESAPHATRRLVLRRLGQAGLVLGSTGALAALGVLSRGRWRPSERGRPIPDHRVAPAPGLQPFVACRGGDPARRVRAALAALGGIDRFVRRGSTVLVKPNMAWDRSPEQGANTSPEVVAEIVRQCLGGGAGRVIVADHPVHDAERSAERSGIRRAVSEAGGELRLPAASGFARARLAGSVLEEWDVLSVLFEAESVINVPIVKNHSLSLLTCGIKNHIGLLGGLRGRLHQEIHLAIADLAAAVKPTLTIVDATRVMRRGGPTGGRLDDVSVESALAAGTDPVACDAWAARLLGLEPREVPHVVQAQGKGLGSIEAAPVGLEEIVVGD